MKCPYQRIITHRCETMGALGKDEIKFNECLGSECPFYYINDITKTKSEGCRKAEKEVQKDV